MEKNILTPQGILDNVTDYGLRLSDTNFPVSVFPQSIQHIIMELHECQSFPIDYVAASMLTAIAVGIGNTHLVQVKSGWLESAILYMALVGRPGANKSHPLSFAMKPFLTYDCQHGLRISTAITMVPKNSSGFLYSVPRQLSLTAKVHEVLCLSSDRIFPLSALFRKRCWANW